MTIHPARIAFIAAFAILALLLPAHAQQKQDAGTQDKIRAAAQSARAWLELVDREDYAQSWEAASLYFKSAVDKSGWVASLDAYRKPLGPVLSREIMDAEYTTALPGAPDSRYVVIRFKTSFANKKSSVETVTPVLDKDGQWRVSGYYIY